MINDCYRIKNSQNKQNTNKLVINFTRQIVTMHNTQNNKFNKNIKKEMYINNNNNNNNNTENQINIDITKKKNYIINLSTII
jgi:hypothetical protein